RLGAQVVRRAVGIDVAGVAGQTDSLVGDARREDLLAESDHALARVAVDRAVAQGEHAALQAQAGDRIGRDAADLVGFAAHPKHRVAGLVAAIARADQPGRALQVV